MCALTSLKLLIPLLLTVFLSTSLARPATADSSSVELGRGSFCSYENVQNAKVSRKCHSLVASLHEDNLGNLLLSIPVLGDEISIPHMLKPLEASDNTPMLIDRMHRIDELCMLDADCNHNSSEHVPLSDSLSNCSSNLVVMTAHSFLTVDSINFPLRESGQAVLCKSEGKVDFFYQSRLWPSFGKTLSDVMQGNVPIDVIDHMIFSLY